MNQAEPMTWEEYLALASADPGAAALALAHRVSHGSVLRSNLELAAFCGHEPASVALGGPWSAGPERLQGDWLEELIERWGASGLGVIAIVKVFSTVAREDPESLDGDPTPLRRALEIYEASDPRTHTRQTDRDLDLAITLAHRAYLRRRTEPYLELIRAGAIEWALSRSFQERAESS